jgi:hypothetical protein
MHMETNEDGGDEVSRGGVSTIAGEESPMSFSGAHDRIVPQLMTVPLPVVLRDELPRMSQPLRAFVITLWNEKAALRRTLHLTTRALDAREAQLEAEAAVLRIEAATKQRAAELREAIVQAHATRLAQEAELAASQGAAARRQTAATTPTTRHLGDAKEGDVHAQLANQRLIELEATTVQLEAEKNVLTQHIDALKRVCAETEQRILMMYDSRVT